MIWRFDMDRFAATLSPSWGRIVPAFAFFFTNPLWRTGRSATPALAAGARGDQPRARPHA
jgi:hypothetical protein